MAGKLPRALRKGSLVGIVSPASPVEQEVLEKGVALLEGRGYCVRVGDHALSRREVCTYLAGEDADRAADLNRFFRDPEIDAIWCAGGGYGSMRLFDRLDWKAAAHHAKVFVGYSDITSLHLALAKRTRGVSFHAAMLATLLKSSEEARSILWRLLEVPEPFGALPTGEAKLETVVGGVAEGELIGGCLCLLAHTCGSHYLPDFRGKIVVIEDVGEAIYRVDRDLTQLLNAGVFDDAAGFVIGTVTGWRKQEADPPRNSPEMLWRDFFAPLNKPTIFGFPFGHERNPLPVPLGVRARLDADAQTLILLEPAVRT